MIWDDRICKLGEGPLWHPAREELFWFDILGKTLHSKAQSWTFSDHVSAAGWVDDDTLILASATALSRFDIAGGALTTLVPLEANNTVTRSNDGRADPQGGFWIGTMGLNAEPGAGAIYRYYKGELRQLYDGIQISNAICFFPDGETACFTDTNTQQIMRVRLDRDGWPTGNPWVHIDLTGTDYRPDGAVIDSTGQLWSAQWGVGRVAVYDNKGAECASYDFPATQISCPAFGGPDLDTLYVTSAAVGLGSGRREDGQTFVMPTDTTGQAEHRVIL